MSAVGYGQRLLRFRSDWLGIVNVAMPVGRLRWSIRVLPLLKFPSVADRIPHLGWCVWDGSSVVDGSAVSSVVASWKVW